VLTIGQDAPVSVLIPPGVAHGFYFPIDSLHVYSMSTAWDPHDDDGCRWSDPGLGLTWSVEDPVLSERDASAGSLDDLVKMVRARGM
jgi:dTDP-4-dehydrorhamnose 3,5-epimerase